MKNKGLKCSVNLCDKKAVCKGMCAKHYQQIKLRGSIIEKDYVFVDGLCKIVGCGKKMFAKGYCQNHYIEKHRKEEEKL